MFNKAILIGNLGKDPEIRSMQSGGEVATFSVATSEYWKDKTTGEKKSKTQWHNIVVFNKGLVTVAKNYLKKGSKVYIEGQIETRDYEDKDGQKKYVTEIVLKQFNAEIKMLDSRDQNGDNNQQRPTNNYEGHTDMLEDEIPF